MESTNTNLEPIKITGREKEISLKEAARFFKVSYFLLHYHVVKGNLRTRRIGKSHLVKPSAVADLLERTKSRGVPRQVVNY